MDQAGEPGAALEHFGRTVAGDPTTVPLDRAALAMAAVLRPLTDVDGALAALDGLAAACPEPTFDALRRHLFEHERFAGDQRRYDDPGNSFLDLVLARRRGLPILLATVVMEVGRRAGIGVVGIGMPMHFLVGDARDPAALADPFSGAALDPDGAERLFESLARGRLAWDRHHLDPVPSRAIVVRMLSNLRASYQRRSDPVRGALVASMRRRIPELAAEEADADRASAAFN